MTSTNDEAPRDSFIRFVVCIDIEGTDVVSAYRKLRSEMQKTRLDWETSDEWYHPDDDGMGSDIETLRSAILEVLGQKEGKT